MRILITGASGFTGPHLIKELNRRKHSLYKLKSNLLNTEELEKELSEVNPESVMHLGGLSHLTSSKPDDLYRVNTIGSLNLLSTVSKKCSKTKKIFLASTAYVYDYDDKKLTEQSPVCPDTHYAMSKLSMEYLSDPFKKKFDLVIFRPFNYTGNGQSAKFFIPKLIKLFKEKQTEIRLGNLDIEREFNDVSWVVSVLADLVETADSSNVFNICSGITYKLREIIKMLENITKHSPKIQNEKKLIRSDEKYKICGDPSKLFKYLKLHNRFKKLPPLESTIKKMLND